jgi:hypothetical protein
VSLASRESRGELLEKPTHGHFVQFYEADDQLLARNVSEYLATGLRAGEPVLAVAAADHRQAFTHELNYLGIETDAAISHGQLTMLDAQETLNTFMLDRRPDRARFQNTVGALIRKIRQRTDSSELRAYGEMVGILWTAGQYSAAIELEELWNELLNSVGFSLYCAYPIDVFGREFQADSVYALLCDHTHVIPAGANGSIESAVTQAINEILGSRGQDLTAGVNRKPTAWAAIPNAEAKILWLRSNVPDSADDVLARARQLYQASKC